MSLKSRPTFAVDLNEPTGAVVARLHERLAAPDVEVRWARTPGGGGKVGVGGAGDHLALTIAESRRHFFSPWLMVDLSATDAGTHIFARFSPHPSVWTGYAFAYMTLGSLGFFSLIFQYAQSVAGSHAGNAAWVSLVAPTAAVLAGLLWTSAQVGQRLAKAEMELLHATLEQGLVAEPEAGAHALHD